MQCVKCCDSYALMTVRPSNFTSAKKNARKACKAFADVFSFDISKTKTPKNSGLFCRDLFRFFLFTEVQSRLQVVGEFVFFEELVKLV